MNDDHTLSQYRKWYESTQCHFEEEPKVKYQINGKDIQEPLEDLSIATGFSMDYLFELLQRIVPEKPIQETVIHYEEMLKREYAEKYDSDIEISSHSENMYVVEKLFLMVKLI